MTVARRILLHVMLGAAFVVAVVTAVTYRLVFSALRDRDLKQLAIYVAERTQREEARFQQIQANLTLVRGQFLKRIETPYPGDLQARWDERFRLFPDGAWRSREIFSDGKKWAPLWCHGKWKPTPEAQHQIVVAQELCEELLPGWMESFPSVYFNFPGPANVGFDARIPSWVWDMPADYDVESPEWLQLALPKTPPEPDKFLWTGVQRDTELDTENPLINSPLVSVFLPIHKDRKFMGSIGHDMYVAQGLLDETVHCDIAGAYHTVFRPDGRLLAHVALREKIMAKKGLLFAQDCGDPAVLSLFKTCTAREDRAFSGFDKASDSYFSAARIAGPDWFFVISMPRERLQQQAATSAQWVLWSGLFSLALVVGFIATILRTQVARPLAELTRATHAMADGADTMPVLAPRSDELGVLAESFREMVTRVMAREHDMRLLNAGLERRVAERTEDLNEALSRERELGDMKSRFVSLVSHEFRTPLGVIMSAVEVLKRYFERLPVEKRARHLNMIFRSTKHLAVLIEEVLLLSQVEEGRMQFKPVPLDLEKIATALVDEIFSATNGACPVHFTAVNFLASAVSDETIIRHIVTNLLSNAGKYSEPGTPVEFTAERSGDDVVLTIRDHGIGIPAEDQPRLFTSFTRGGNVGTRPGTGLGLVVVQRCVQLHRGTLALHSVLGEGTTVTVTLPVFNQPPAS